MSRAAEKYARSRLIFCLNRFAEKKSNTPTARRKNTRGRRALFAFSQTKWYNNAQRKDFPRRNRQELFMRQGGAKGKKSAQYGNLGNFTFDCRSLGGV